MRRCRRQARVAALALAMLVAVPIRWSLAQDTAVAAPDWLEALDDAFSWSFNGQAYLYGNGLARTPGSLVNPDNEFARLPNLALTGELRPNAKATSQYLDVVVQPRFSSVYESGGIPATETARGYLQEGYVRAKPTDDINIIAGRELLTWGPAFFRSPSNPFYFNNARLNPILELSGIDLARVSYNLGPHVSLTAGLVFHSGHDLVPNDAYRHSLLLKADYKDTDYLGSLILNGTPGHSLFVGGYAQATVNDATLVYGEVGASSVSKQPGVSQFGRADVFSQPVASQRSATALVGSSYTFENGQSINAEYLFNGFGYGPRHERDYFRTLNQMGVEAASQSQFAGLATQGIGYGAVRSEDLLGRNYLYLQYQNNPSDGETLWRLMLSENLTDGSAQPGFYIEHSNFGESVIVFPRAGQYRAAQQ